MADGSVVATSMERHDDPDVEALRWLLTEGGLIQAIGRLRPHRRNEPCWLHILADVPLPIIVRETVRWKAVKPGVVGVMAAQGVILTNVSDAGLAFNLTDREGRGLVRFSKNNISLEKCTSPRPLRRFTYQKTGSGQKSWQGWYLPAVLPGGEAALRTWLEGKLGPLASLTVDRVKAKDSPAVQAMFAKIGRSLWQPSPLHLVATLRAAASWIEREAAEAPKASGSW